MLHLKTGEQVELLRASNQLVSRTLAELAKIIRPGVTTLRLDQVAEEFIRDNKALPGFKGYNNFPNTLCTSVNDEVVHGIPSQYELRDGDIISIDCGVILEGFYGDSAFTFSVGEISGEKRRLLDYTRDSLEEGARMAIQGNRVGDVSWAVQNKAESGGYSVVRELVGHGLGKNLHEFSAIHLGGLYYFIRQAGVGVSKKEGCKTDPIGDMNKHQPTGSSCNTENSEYAGHRDQDDLERNKTAEQDKTEQQVITFKPPF